MATVTTLREGKLFSVIWNETDMLDDVHKNDGPHKFLDDTVVTPEVEISFYLKRSLNPSSAAILPGVDGPVARNCVELEAHLIYHKSNSNQKLSKVESSSTIIDVTMDGVRRQMSQWKVGVLTYITFVTWSASWENHPVDGGSVFQLLIDLDPIENANSLLEKKNGVPRRIMEKMLTDRTLADVTFTFPGNFW